MKFLIVKTSSLGDLIHTFPVINYLHRKYPTAQIDWVVESSYAELIRSHSLVDRVITINSKSWRKSMGSKSTRKELLVFRNELQKTNYDVVFDLQGNIKSGIITGFAKAKSKVGFSYDSVPEWPNILFTRQRFSPGKDQNIRVDYLSIVQQYFNDTGSPISESVNLGISEQEQKIICHILDNSSLKNELRILVCPGSMWRNKQVSIETLAGFLKLIANEKSCSFIFAWGSKDEEMIAQTLYRAFPSQSIVLEKLSLPVLQNLMKRVQLVIAMDSLPLHLAGTAGIKTFSAFGASSAKKYKPEGSQHTTIQGNCPYHRTFDKRCPILRTCSTGLCIKGLTSEDLFLAYKNGGH